MPVSPLLSTSAAVYIEPAILPTGDLENRAVIREPANLLITNATRSDTAKYRCEVTAADDQKSFDEIVIDLVVRGTLPYPHHQLICISVFGPHLECTKIKPSLRP